jgi:hypothetical protein
MVAALVPVLIAGGGVAYVMAKKNDAPYVPTPIPAGRIAPAGGSTVMQASAANSGGAIINTLHPSVFAAPAPMGTIAFQAVNPISLQTLSEAARRQANAEFAIMAANSISTATLQNSLDRQSSQSSTIDLEMQKKLDLLEAYMKQQFLNAEDVARAAMIDKLNKELKLDPPLDTRIRGEEGWKLASAAAGAAGGSAVGNYFCGAPCGKIGAMAGAWLGEKLGPYLQKGYEECKEWCKEVYGDIVDWVSDTASDVWDWATGWI